MSETLDNALYQWASSTIPTRDVLFANSIDSNTPDTPCIVLYVQQQATAQNPLVTLSEDGTCECIQQQTLATVSVDCIGDEKECSAQQASLALAASLSASARYQDLWTVSGLGGITLGPQSLTTATLGVNRPRWQFQFTLYSLFTFNSSGQYFQQTALELIEAGSHTQIPIDPSGDKP